VTAVSVVPPAREQDEAGFTLVEMMVALAIFALIAAAGTGLLAFGVRAQAAAGARMDGTGALRRFDALLGADLAQATPRLTRDAAGASLPAFVGDGAIVAGLVRGGWSNPDARARASLQKVAWVREGDAIVRRTWPMLDGAAPSAAVTMLRGVTGFAVRYRFADGSWHDRWETTKPDALPRLVEVTVTRTKEAPVRAVYLVGTGA